MKTDELLRYFAVPVGEKYALFTFKPYDRMVSLLDDFGIPCTIVDNKEDLYKSLPKRCKKIKSDHTRLVKYRIEDAKNPKYETFYFTSSIIDSVLDEYGVKYKKGDEFDE